MERGKGGCVDDGISKRTYRKKTKKVGGGLILFSVDIDSNSILHLLKTAKKALNLGLRIKKIEISPSGKGFHIIVENDSNDEIQTIIDRALLDDDAYRLRYSIKRLSMGGVADVCFDRKGDKKSVPIEIDLVELKKTDILEVGTLVDKYKVIIGKLLKRTFMTVFEVPDKHEDKIREVLADISVKDKTFRYRIYPNLYKKGKTKWIAVVYNPSKDKCHKRGCWLKHKVLVDGKEIIEGYWCKEIQRKK